VEVDTVDPENSTVSGKAEAGATVRVWVNVPEKDAERIVTAEGGNWTADFKVAGPGDNEKRTSIRS